MVPAAGRRHLLGSSRHNSRMHEVRHIQGVPSNKEGGCNQEGGCKPVQVEPACCCLAAARQSWQPPL